MRSSEAETHHRFGRGRTFRRVVAATGIAAAGLVAWTVPGQAQTDPPPADPPPTNFHMAGVADAQAGTMLAVDKQVSGEFQYCSNLNGLGAELYLNAGDGAGMAVEQATVTPFVVPIHIGVLSVNNPDPENPIEAQRYVTLGVVKGTPVQFGSSGDATVEYGGVFFGANAGLVNWTYAANISCTESKAMPIINQALGTDVEVPTTTEAPTTTVAPTTTEAPTTTVAPTTTESTTTLAP